MFKCEAFPLLCTRYNTSFWHSYSLGQCAGKVMQTVTAGLAAPSYFSSYQYTKVQMCFSSPSNKLTPKVPDGMVLGFCVFLTYFFLQFVSNGPFNTMLILSEA